ncbi:DUF4252 domain-containing protein [Candidatus Fermentibacteria bacterium]|nr:DUF4252 domain-containing protein [Candidatus Fermentibacteria bacterium]
MKRSPLIVVLLCSATLALAADPVQKELRDHPGFVDLSRIKIPSDASSVTEVTIGPDLLKATLAALPESVGAGLPPDLLDGLIGLQVRSFKPSSGEAKAVQHTAQQIASDLLGKGWSRIIRVADGDDLVTIDFKYQDGGMAGLMIMAIEPDEVALVNIVGSLNLQAILSLASQGLDPAALDSLQKAVQQATGSK